jgi:hypothetical protein
LGAKIISYIPPKAILSLGDRKFQISAWEYITISTSLPINGYLSIERKFLGGGFDVFYDDKEWADRVLKHSKLLTLIEEKRVPNLSSFKIEGNTLKVEIYTRKIDSKTTEDVKKAIEFMLEVIPSLEGLPSSALGVQKHKLRNWVLFYIPLGIFLLLSALGFYWMEQGYYKALCEDELYILGFKILTPVFLAHFVLSVLILGKHLHLKAYLLPLFIGYFDENCSLRVSESFYKRVDVGDTLVLYVKEGAFGVRWAYKYGKRQKNSSS